MPTNTIGVGTGVGTPDYSTFATWWAAVPATFTEDVILRVLHAGNADNEIVVSSEVDLTGKDFNGFRLIIEPEPGDGWRDHADVATNPQRYDNTKGACILGSGSNVRGISFNFGSVTNARVTIRGLQVKTNGVGYRGSPIRLRAVTDSVIEDCILEHAMNYPGVAVDLWTNSPSWNSNTSTLRNNSCVVKNANGMGFYAERVSTPDIIDVFGNTLVNVIGGGAANRYGVMTKTTTSVNQYLSTRVANNAIFGFTRALFVSTTPTGTGAVDLDTNNATNLASGAAGFQDTVNSLFSLTASDQFESVTSGSENLRLKTGSALIDAGTASYGPTLDIYGNARVGTTDIGAHEFGGGAPPPPPPPPPPSGPFPFKRKSITGAGMQDLGGLIIR